MQQRAFLQDQVTRIMERTFAEIPFGIEHTRRVLQNAQLIAAGEKVGKDLQEVITIAALLHDIGAPEALRKFGSLEGPYQEAEGMLLARQILERLEVNPALRERVCFLVGHHHSPAMINGMDFQVLWEADLLDNTEYGDSKPDPGGFESWIVTNFQTGTGRALARSRLNQPE